MEKYEIINYDFQGEDGKIKVTLKQKAVSQAPKSKDKTTNKQPHTELTNQLIKIKYRCPKTDIQSLKILLKRPYNVKEFKEFYRVYGPKLIEIDFGKIELFNIKGKNQFCIDELHSFKIGENFSRWGKFFSIAQLQKYKTSTLVQDQIVALQYYNMLARERLFTLRTCRYYKNDGERKKFPYQNLYIYDLEDCLQFNLRSFQELVNESTKISEYLPILKLKFFQQYFADFNMENIIVPFFQLRTDEQQQIQLFFVHLNKNGYQIKLQGKYNSESQDNIPDKMNKAHIFVNYDNTFYSKLQLKNGILDFVRLHNFELKDEDFQFININLQAKNLLEEYVDYIEKEFFLSTVSNEERMNYIFNILPQELSQKPFNSILDDKFLFPQNVQEVMQKLFEKSQ